MAQIQCIESQKSGCWPTSLRARGQNPPESRATKIWLRKSVPLGIKSHARPFFQSVKGTEHEFYTEISKNAFWGLKFGLIWPKFARKLSKNDYNWKNRPNKSMKPKWNFPKIQQKGTPELIYMVYFMIIYHILAKKDEKNGGPAWFRPLTRFLKISVFGPYGPKKFWNSKIFFAQIHCLSMPNWWL